jgi:cysteinyl-tRNA synthetase
MTLPEHPMELRLYNTLTRTKEVFQPIEPGRVHMYTCGPTVYRFIHIGNLRSFMLADWVRRTLLHFGYEVKHVKNITDVGHMRQELLDRGEDKMIAAARKEGKSPLEIAASYTQAFMEDEARVNILPAHVFPRATDHVPEMIDITQRLLANRLAYEVDGTVYFDVSAFPNYGRLSRNEVEGLLGGVRGDVATDKHAAEDFALWKAAEPGRVMKWDSPWGEGFPGWHIECSAMSIKHLGEQIDIHTGGVDLVFPHHEDEIAQSEGYTGKPFVNYWVHGQHLLVDGLKMAKSTRNDYRLVDLITRGFDPLALRYLYATAHYRTRLNFTFDALRAAQRGLGTLRERLLEYDRAQAGGERDRDAWAGQ